MSALERGYRANLVGVVATGICLAVGGILIQNSYHLTTLVFSIISAIAAIGLTLLFGFAGLASLGQAAFFGLGAYTAAILVERMGWPVLAGVAAAIVVPSLFGWLIGRPLLRLSGNYLTMASLALGVVMYLAFSQTGRMTGGLDPGFMLQHDFAIGPVTFGDTRGMYWVCSVGLLITLLVAINLVHSRFGRGLRALKSSEAAAEGVGIPTVAFKAAVFAVSAGMAGFAGALYAFFMRSFNATAFGFPFSIELLIIVIIGSLRSIWGALLGALIVTILPTLLEGLNDYKLFIYGSIMVVIMMFLPDGLFHGVIEGLGRLNRKKVSS